MKIFLFIVAAFLAANLYSQNKKALAESDSLFAKGVELYNHDKYNEAILLFEESDKIDKAELDSTSNRRDYSAMWLASCYYKMGDEEKAGLYYSGEFWDQPVDRRLTILSDSLSAVGMALAQDGKYQEAIPYILQCADIEKEIVGEEHFWYINSLYTIIDLYLFQEKYEDALKWERLVLDIFEKSLGKNNIQYISFLAENSQNLINIGEYNDALSQYKEALYLLQQSNIAADDWKSMILIGIADCYNLLDNYSEAINTAKEALNIALNVYGKDHPGYANLLGRLAIYNSQQGNYDIAVKLATEAKDILLDTLGENHSDYVSILDNLSEYYYRLSDYNKAIELGNEALNISELLSGKQTSNYTITLCHVASYYEALGDYQKAKDYYREASTTLKCIYGEEHLYYLSVIAGLANSYAHLNNYTKAIELCVKCLDITKKRYGTDNAQYFTSLSNLAGFYCDMGNYSEAIKLGIEGLKIKEKIYGRNHPNYIQSLGMLASYYSDMGEYEEEANLNSEALKLFENNYGKIHMDYVRLLESSAISFSHLGDYNKAIDQLQDAIEIQQKITGKNHPLYISILVNLSRIYSRLNNIPKAINLSLDALEIGETLGYKNQSRVLSDLSLYSTMTGNYDVAINFATQALNMKNEKAVIDTLFCASLANNLSIACARMGNDSLAFHFSKSALEILRCKLGDKHPKYVSTLSNMAYYKFNQKKYKEAVCLGEKVLQIENETGRNKLPNYVDYLKSQAIFSSKVTELFSQCSEYVMNTNRGIQKLVMDNFAYLTSRERLHYWYQYREWFEYEMPQIAYYNPEHSILSALYDGMLLAKELLLHTDLEFQNLIYNSKNDKLITVYNEIQSERFYLNRLYNRNDSTLYAITDSLENIIQQKEHFLIQQSVDFGNYTKNLTICWQDVQKELGTQDVAIEFLNFPIEGDSTMYVALILKEGMPSPQLVSLFEEKQLSKVSIQDYYTTPALSKLVWKPLAEELKGIKNIYFAPAGQLHNIAIEYLPSSDSTFIAENFNFYRLSSTRQLALNKEKKQSKDVVLYGGLKYDTDTTTLIAESKKYPWVKRGWDSQYTYTTDSLMLRESPVYLPGTKVEAEKIKEIVEEKKWQTSFYTDLQGPEESFKALSGKPINMLHIATHGFYWTEQETKKMKKLDFLMINEDQPQYEEDKALTRSGLLLSGANVALKGVLLPEGIDDGILTAKEIAELDLRTLDLVVLSACQTGLGEITGDGVFGLQRGFKKAGVNTLLMSLWKVDDEATRLLMTHFYQNLLSGQSKFESLREAQQFVRDYEVEVKDDSDSGSLEARMGRRENKDAASKKTHKVKPYKNPFYWAAFILLDAI